VESGLWVRTVAASIRGEGGMTGDELDEGDASAIALEERFDALVRCDRFVDEDDLQQGLNFTRQNQ
jgi:hypothetical protein